MRVRGTFVTSAVQPFTFSGTFDSTATKSLNHRGHRGPQGKPRPNLGLGIPGCKLFHWIARLKDCEDGCSDVV